MYHLTPFRYLVEGLLGVLLHKLQVECADSEYARFSPPPNQSCQDYTQQFVQRSGGYVRERNGLCLFCQYADGDQYVRLIPEAERQFRRTDPLTCFLHRPPR